MVPRNEELTVYPREKTGGTPTRREEEPALQRALSERFERVPYVGCEEWKTATEAVNP